MVKFTTARTIRPETESILHLDQKLTYTTPQATLRSVDANAKSPSTPKNEYYVYLHLRKSDGSVFYVGKGKGRRAWNLKHRTNSRWQRVSRKHGCEVVLVAQDLPEVCALSMERALIGVYRNSLVNMTDGGEGASGYVHTPEGRAKMSAAWEGRVVTEEWRANMSKARKGKPHSPEHVRKQAEAQRGKVYSEETKAKIGAAQRGKKLSPDHIAAISKPLKCDNGMNFPSSSAAARWVRENTSFHKASGVNIRYCLKGITTSAYGFVWCYL